MRALAIIALATTTTACGGDDDPLGRDQDVVRWANTASALGVFTTIYEPVAFAGGRPVFADPACPVTSDDGTTATIRGGCTDANSVSWTGQATVVRDAAMQTITLDRFGHDALLGPIERTGIATIRDLGSGRSEFDVDAMHVGGITTDITYTGTVDGNYDTPTRWNGRGTIAMTGDFIAGGSVLATTLDQVRDPNVCGSQPASGTTTLESPEHVVVISYDGAIDCDDANRAAWSRDGQDRGFLDGVTCAAGGRGSLAPVAAIGWVWWRRRRRATAARYCSVTNGELPSGVLNRYV